MIDMEWGISVQDFGAVKRADITMAPFVVMVGKNNTGKSYVSSLIWAILSFYRPIFTRRMVVHERYAAFRQFVTEIRQGQKDRLVQKDWELICRWINTVLEDHKDEIGSRLLACGDCTYKRFQIRPTRWPGELKIKLLRLPESRRKRSARRRLVGGLPFRRRQDTLELLVDSDADVGGASSEDLDREIMWYLGRTLISAHGRESALYIPAARTGLMLAYKTIVAGLLRTFEQGDDDETSRASLPAPVVGFLEELNFLLPLFPDHSHFEIAQAIEHDVLQGQLEETDNEDFFYTPSRCGSRLPLHAVSSLVSELAPLVLLLKSGLEGRTIIFEEPEAHLHLEAQRSLVRNLIRVVNSGTQVIITTHSDTLLQQINILMYLHQHPSRENLIEEFGYHLDELLDPVDARGYLFADSGEGTVVHELQKTRSGFAEPVMNETISALTREILRLEETDTQ